MIEQYRGYILHTRPYRNSSLLIDAFTQERGRISAVARGARGGQSKLRGQLQAFIPLWFACRGKGDLQTCQQAEPLGPPLNMQQLALYSGWYVNELILRLCPLHEVQAELFSAYQKALEQLSAQVTIEITLRQFEICLLQHLGYQLDFSADAIHSRPLREETFYDYVPEQGFIALAEPGATSTCYAGKALRAIAANDFTQSETLRVAKQLTRVALQRLLGNKPLHTRRLVQALQRSKTNE